MSSISQNFQAPYVGKSSSSYIYKNEGTFAVPNADYTQMEALLSHSLCMVHHAGNQGTGSLINLKKFNGPSNFYTFMTCNHVVPTIDRAELCGVQLNFTDPNLGTFFIQADWIQSAWTHHRLDVTVIEFTDTAFNFLNGKRAIFLPIEQPQVYDKVALFQFPNGVLSNDNDVILAISRNGLEYYIGGDGGSSGAPLIKWATSHVVGIHRRRLEGQSNQPLVPFGYKRSGSNIIDIYEAFVEQRLGFASLMLFLSD